MKLLPLLALSGALCIGTYVGIHTLRWTDKSAGFANALMHAPFYIMAWALVCAVPGILLYALFSWRKWHRFRAVITLAPAFAVCAMMVWGLVANRPTPAGRLKMLTGATLPSSAHELRVDFRGGGMTDYTDWYKFRCDPAETAVLIKSLRLELVENSEHPRESPFPDKQPGEVRYQGYKESGWFYDLRTDQSGESVELIVGGT